VNDTWLAMALTYPVEHLPATYLHGNVSLSRPAAGVLHTTEGSFQSALDEFKTKFAPHFLVGHGRIIQFAPLGKMSFALEHTTGQLETNGWARAQIEIAGRSQLHPWLPESGTLDALASLVAALEDAAGIPMKRAWPDGLCRSVRWATAANPRRHEGAWGREAGWFGHIEIPGNSHWDPGALTYTALFARARVLKERSRLTPTFVSPGAK
jgi:hypothetical protein